MCAQTLRSRLVLVNMQTPVAIASCDRIAPVAGLMEKISGSAREELFDSPEPSTLGGLCRTLARSVLLRP